MHKITSYLMLDEQAKELVDHVNGTTISLTFSEAAVLAQLSSTNAIITKEKLLQVGWPERVVTPTSLTNCISTLRKKLEPYTEVQLKTMSRRGYQLHVSRQSQLKILAMKEAIFNSIVGVSTWTKIFGIMLLCLILGAIWYISERHAVVRDVAKWHADKSIELTVGGAMGAAKLLYRGQGEQLEPGKWQQHLAPEGNHIANLKHFSAFASTDGLNYSMSICLEQDAVACKGTGIINITSINAKPAGLNMEEFIPLSQKMEQRIRYNKVMLPSSDRHGAGELIEHNYQADIYFPVLGELMVRADLSMSLVYDGENKGKFYSATCITDEDCLTTPLKYTLRGDFTQYQTTIDDLKVDVFHVKVQQKELTKPDDVSHSAMEFYREIRKHDIRDKDLFYYRIHHNEHSAVWIVPLIGDMVAWSKYTQVNL
ncbi:MAG: winged helix-turn-helix domain-containing protein [Shewanella sp.]